MNDKDDQSTRGAAEENTGVADTPEEHQGPASPASTPGGDSNARADGAAEENAGVAEPDQTSD